MKEFIINEQQEKLLIKEFMQQGFSLAVLNSLSSPKEKYEYCLKYLGEPIGGGNGRIVFEIGDDTVIKINRQNSKTSAFFRNQNEGEWLTTTKLANKFPNLFTKVYQHADDYSWIITERVLPFKHEDCLTLLGIPYSSSFNAYARDFNRTKQGFDTNTHNKDIEGHIGYEKYMNPKQIGAEYYFDEDTMVDYSLEGFVDWAERFRYNDSREDENEAFNELMTENEWFKELFKYIQMIRGCTDIFGDNFGLAMRNGKPQIVILDNGFENFYT